MARGGTFFAVALLGLATFSARAAADGKGKSMRPQRSTDEQAVAAVAIFEEEFKAKGLKGDDKTSQRDFAMTKLAKVQHAKVVEVLAKIGRSTDPTLRTLSVLYLGEQRALPGTAGKEVVAILDRNRKDLVLVLSALDSFGNLRYVGAPESIRDLMKDQNFSVKKAAIVAAGRTRDVRLLPDLLRLVGVEAKADGGDDKVVVTEGYSWPGAEASVDTGTPGPGDQQAAEAQVAAQLAANQAAAEAAAGGGSGGGVSDGPARPGGGGGRSLKELIPHILRAVRFITGQEFLSTRQIADWLAKNKDWLAAERKAVEEETKRQASEAKPG
jgi:hypothetical protein